MNKKFFEKIIFSKKEIQDKIIELAEWINTKYKDSENLVLISTMLGSIPFSMDLSKHIDIVHELDFIGVKSYYGGKKQSDCIVVDKEIDVNIKGKDVVILEDIIDSGRTLEKIREILESREPNSLWILTLLKREKNNVDFKNMKYGFEVKEGLFLVGYGLDYKYKYRHLQDIGIFNKKYLEEDRDE